MKAWPNADFPLKPALSQYDTEHALSAEEQRLYLDFVQFSQCIDTSETFQQCILEFVRPLLPHAMTLACLGGIVSGKAVLEMAVAVDYPEALFDKVHEVVSIADRSLLARWYSERKPQLIERGLNDHLLSPMERSEMDVFGFDNFVAHGVIDLDGKRGSYISLAGIAGKPDTHLLFLMELMVPHLHQALVRILHYKREVDTLSKAQLLTPKEEVVLRWLAAGKSNPEIAALLNRSVFTIRNQVHSILGKLGASSRAEALHKSHEMGLL